VVKIGELQSIFTEKLLELADDIERVHADTVASTENIKGGNEAVRQAIQNKASYRVYILFIITQVFSDTLFVVTNLNEEVPLI
jgi:syntaxin 18